MALPSCRRPFRQALSAGLLAALPLVAGAPAHGHGADGQASRVAPGAFRFVPVITVEGHGGFETNLDGQPRHYAIDAQFGTVLEWGLSDGGVLGLELELGPALVWGEAEHFYGRVEPAGEDELHDGIDSHGHDHGPPGSNWRRTDLKGRLQVLYQPTRRLELSATWMPYLITTSQGEDQQGLSQQIALAATLALGDGDLNFALGDGLETIADGLFVALENRNGWSSDGTYLGTYTDSRLGLGFNVDLLNVSLDAGPRFYSPGSYASLSGRVDWAGELALTYPLTDRSQLFAHWQPVYNTQVGEAGWVHHLGAGVTFRF
jgi:hypothetical protein